MDNKTYKKFSSPCNCINLRRASQAITEFYDEAVASTGLKTTQLSLLKHINRLGPLNMSELAKAVRLDRTTLARNLKVLEAQGFIAIITGKDSRTRQLHISEKGLKILKTADPYWVEAQEKIKKYLGEEDLKTLTRLLLKIEEIVP